MAEFRTKLITLAGIATMFAGMAHAQLNTTAAPCTATTNAIFVAAEGKTEQIADTTISCPAVAGGGTASLNISVYLSPAVNITSAVLGTGNSAKSETLAGIGVFGAPLTGAVNGSVSGSSVTFTGITVGPAATTLTITNIKIDASTIATSSGAPTAVNETLFMGGTNVTPGVLTVNNVAFATNGLGGVKSTQASGNSIASIPICSGGSAFGTTTVTVGGTNYSGTSQDANYVGFAAYNTGSGGSPNTIVGNAAFNVQFSEAFATAFKVAGTAAGNVNLGSEFGTTPTYTGYGYSANSTTNSATSGTRIQIVFNNIPANVTAYVPLSVQSGVSGLSNGTLTLVNSATGAIVAIGSTANGAPGATASNNGGNGSAAALSVSNGSATAIYEVTATTGGALETYTVPVFLQAGGAAVTAPSGAVTATVSFAPIGSSTNVPNFVSGSSTTTVNGAAFSACSSTLLFPFVTNQLGFDTGIAISNTSSDLLNGGTKSNAAAQSGTCSLTFFGSTAPTAAVTTPTITSGTAYAAATSTLAPGFQGYMIASCNFLYGHGFAYVVYNLTQNNDAAMGYLANVLNSDRKSSVAADLTVGSNAPESAGQ